jgi:hypothetical protein
MMEWMTDQASLALFFTKPTFFVCAKKKQQPD